MNKIVVYHSYSGNCSVIGWKIAESEGATLAEVVPYKSHNRFFTYLLDSRKAMKCETVPIREVDKNFNDFDEIIIVSPIWAGFATPTINAFIDEFVPSGKKVSMVFSSASGKKYEKAEEVIRERITKKGATLIQVDWVKSAK